MNWNGAVSALNEAACVAVELKVNVNAVLSAVVKCPAEPRVAP